MGSGDEYQRLGRDFFAREAPVVARDLIGKLLVKDDDGIVARIVETEAYSDTDPASHAFRGPTPRNAPMFGPPGHAYVYFTYGMHHALNCVTGEEGVGQGCLIRAAEPLEGFDVMRSRRGAATDRDLLRGPGRLAQALALTREHSGLDLCAGGNLYIADDGQAPPKTATGPRTGITLAADKAWRFFVPDSQWVSPYKRHPRAPAAPPPQRPG